MAEEDAIKVDGKVVEVLPNKLYRVELGNGHHLVAHLPRKKRSMEIPLGKTVTVQMTPFDLSKGCIVI